MSKACVLPDSFTIDGKPWDILWLRQASIPHGDTGKKWGGMTCFGTRQVFVCIGTEAAPRETSKVIISFEHERLHAALAWAGVPDRLSEDEHTRVVGALVEAKVSAGTIDLRAWDAALRRARGGKPKRARKE